MRGGAGGRGKSADFDRGERDGGAGGEGGGWGAMGWGGGWGGAAGGGGGEVAVVLALGVVSPCREVVAGGGGGAPGGGGVAGCAELNSFRICETNWGAFQGD